MPWSVSVGETMCSMYSSFKAASFPCGNKLAISSNHQFPFDIGIGFTGKLDGDSFSDSVMIEIDISSRLDGDRITHQN